MRDPYPGAVVVVTGAASGIGAALVTALGSRGADVVATDVNAEALDALAGSVAGRVSTAVLDVAEDGAVGWLLEGVAAKHGRLDFVFNNAGIVAGGDFDLTYEDVWRRVVDVNLWGVVNGTRAAYALMLRQGSGHIVNTSSSAGVMPVAQSVAYATTKHAVMGLSTIDRVPFAKISPAKAAAYILDGVAKNKQQIVFPFYNKVLCSLTRLMPSVMSRVINP